MKPYTPLAVEPSTQSTQGLGYSQGLPLEPQTCVLDALYLPSLLPSLSFSL